jgi:aspartyl-tRNA synthetase
MIQNMREFMSGEGFLEIETPILCKSTPEGARDYLVPSRVHPGNFYALPQSPQLFKQLLMCSGFDRYFQIAKCFRDEDLRADRQPEFTQADMELSFVDVDDVIDVNERLIQYVAKKTFDLDVALPLPRMKWIDAMNNYGSDKPDTRFDMTLVDITDEVKDCGFAVFSDAAAMKNGSVRGINVKGQGGMARKKIDALVTFAKGYGAKGLPYIQLKDDGSVKCSFAKFMKEEEITAIVEKMHGEKGDLLLIAADQNKIVWNVLGALRLKLGEELGLIDHNKFNFLWVVEFPLLEWSDEEERFVAMHHPFTMPMDEDWHLIDSDPGAVRAKAYDIVLNGVELGGGSVRIHDKDLQKKMFTILGLTDEECQEKFGFLIEAFKYGAPPHAGLAYGLDRLVMLLLGEKSIREVIAFPKNQAAECPVCEAPAPAGEGQLEELGIAENTLILFMGDNGGDAPLGGAADYGSSAPFKGKKGSEYEGGVRVPFIASWAKPDEDNKFQKEYPIAVNAIQTQMGTIMDIFPTVLSAAGLDMPQDYTCDGSDLKRLLNGQRDRRHRKDFLMHFPHGEHRCNYFTTYRKGKWKLIYYYDPETPDRPEIKLYDLKNDPYETQEISESRPYRTRRMLKRMIKRLDCEEALYPVDGEGKELRPKMP